MKRGKWLWYCAGNDFFIFISVLIILGRNAFVIISSDALNIVTVFEYFLGLFINITKDAAVSSFISDNISVSFIEILKPWEFIIRVLVINLIIIFFSLIHGNF